MKRMMPLGYALFLIAATASNSWAVDEHHPDKASGTAASAPRSAPPSKEAIDAQLRKMQLARDKAAKATTSKQRQMAMQEQLQAMQSGMAMMQAMEGMPMGVGMMDCPAVAKDAAGNPTMPDQRMHMMDMMMQMMDQQGSMMSMPKKP